jgi:PAS domain S-box-containing protein
MIFGLAAVASIAFSAAKLRAEARRKQVENRLRMSESRLTLAQSAAHLGVWDRDLHTNVLTISGEYSRLCGLTPDHPSFTYEEWLALIHPDDRERVQALMRETLERTHVWDAEYRVVWPDGSAHWMLGKGAVYLDENGRPAHITGVNLDITERKQVEVVLRESEERFRAIFSQAAVGIAQTSLDGDWLLVNDRLCEILGYTQAELHGKSFLDITHPEDREASLTVIRRLLAGEISSHSIEKRYVRKDGAIVWARLFLTLERAQDNRPQYFVAIVEDTTEKMQAECALRDSERRLTLAQSAAHLVLWERDLRTNVIVSSGEHARVYGVTPDHPQLKYEEWLRVVHPDDRERVQTAVRKAVEQTRVWDGEFRVIWPDGSVHWLYTKGTVFFDDSGQPVRLAGVNLDITERKQAEAALLESEQRFRHLADAVPVMLWVCGPDKRFTFFNKTWLDFTGRTLEQELGSGWAEGVHPDDLDPCFASFSSSFDARQDFRIECRLRRADGEYRWVLCTGVPRFEPNGVFAGYIGSDIDINDQKRAEAMRRRNLDEIAHMNRVAAMGELTASLAHELNQPLAAILSNAQAANRFLSSESPDLAQARECLTDIVADDKRAGAVIRRLRGLLKKGKSQASLVDLNEVVSDALRLVSNDAMLRQTSVKFELSPALPAVVGDRVQLSQIVLNLIVNGLEAVAERPVDNRWLLVRTSEPDGGGVQLTVEDSGNGIAESDLDRVFEPFFSTKPEGLGMGLSISRSIVETHGGRLWAEKSTKGGAIFNCALPVAQQAAAASAPFS